MNPLMIQQAVSTVRALQGKTANSAGHGQDFAAIARDALGVDGMAASGKSTRDETNPLAALLLAALFTQPQTTIDTDTAAGDTAADTQTQCNLAVDASTARTAAPASTPGMNENLITLLQALGMDQDEAQDFARQLDAVLQTPQQAAPQVSPADIDDAASDPTIWAVAQQTAQTLMTAPITTDILMGAPMAAGTPTATGIPMAAVAVAPQGTISQDTVDPIAQVRHLLGKLLGDTVVPENTDTERNAPPAGTKTVLTLRALLADLQAAQQTTTAASATPQGDTRQEDPDSDDVTADAGTTTDTAPMNAMPATVAFPELGTADTAAQSPRRTLNEAFDTMVDTITTLRNSDKSEMEIHLKPDFLGKVVIKLTMEDGSLVARISASSSSVQDAFQTQAPQLTTALQQSGIKDVTVLVTHDMASGNALDQSTARQQHNPREQRRRSWAVQDTTEKNDAARATAAYEQFWRNGTINYLA